jgi:hypothetical protein
MGVITTKCNCGATLIEELNGKSIKSGWGYCPNCGYVKLSDGVQYILIDEGGE